MTFEEYETIAGDPDAPKKEPKTLLEKYEQMTALGCVWHLLWDRRYGPRIQDRLRDGGYLDDDFCFEIKRQAVAELQRIEANRKGDQIDLVVIGP